MASRCRVGHRSRHSGRRRHRPRTHLLEVGTEKPRRGRLAAGLPTTGILFWLASLAPETVPATAFLVLQILDSSGKTASNWIGAGIGVAVSRRSSAPCVVFVLISGVNPSAFVDMQYSVDMGHNQNDAIPAAPRGIFMCTRYSGLGRNTPPIAFCASSIAFFWASHCRSARSVIAFSWVFHCCST